jgi:UDP-glucose 4-epimerase
VKGREGEIQLLHEDDLGEALYLAIAKDLPGTFNLGPDDYSTLRKISRLSGARLIDLAPGTLKFLVDFLYALRLEKMSRGWVTMMEYPIIVSNAKFKEAAGWQPRYGTEAAFLDFLRSRLPR